MSGGDGSNGSRVSIRSGLRKMIEDIKEIVVGKDFDDDRIYAMLKESSMDPNEAVQKLLCLEEKSATMSGGAGGDLSSVSRVPIPSSVRKTIQDIKEIAAGRHSDDDIYAMLKECSMDPNETVQKLLYLDTFHEVKKKRDKRNVNVGRASEEYRRASGMQRQGTRGGREKYTSFNASDDSQGRRQLSAQQENGINNSVKRNFKHSTSFLHERENNIAPIARNSSTALMNGPKNVPNGGFSHEAASQESSSNTSDASKFSLAADDNMLNEKPPLSMVTVKQLPTSKPGPTAPYPIESSTILPCITSESVTPASVLGVYSSASDPILVPSLSSRNLKAVGTIKCAKGMSDNATESIPFQGEIRLNADQNVGNSCEAASDIMNSSIMVGQSVPQDIEMNQHSETSRGSSLTSSDGTPAVVSNQDDRPAKQVHGNSEVMVSQAEAVMVEELDRKLEKLSISTHQSVIFPDHLQVPEALRKGLTFGSLDATLAQSSNCEEVFTVTSENNSATKLAGIEPSHSNHYAPTTDKEGEHSSCPPPHSTEVETLLTLGDNASSGASLESDPTKQDILAPTGVPQYPLMQTAPDYSFGFLPPVPGPHFVRFEGAESQGGNSIAPSTSGSTPPPTQPSGPGQSSFAFPTQLLPYLRQPYPPNFIPYNPYFPHLYMPHNPHQFLGHSILPQQPVASNLHVPPAAAAKLPVPALYKMGTIAGNLTQYGVPSGCGSYGAPTVGSNPSPASTSGGTCDSEDLAASELKKDVFSALKQNEESQTWTSAHGRELSMLQANYFYNMAPGQRLAFLPAHTGQGPFAGVYPLSQTLGPPPSAVQLLPQQSPATAGSVESVVPTSTFQQQQAQFNWNSRILNRENI